MARKVTTHENVGRRIRVDRVEKAKAKAKAKAKTRKERVKAKVRIARATQAAVLHRQAHPDSMALVDTVASEATKKEIAVRKKQTVREK